MLFNSFVFAVFFPIVLAFYWILPLRAQNVMLLMASYVFYGYWDWRFLSLLALSTIVDYVTGLKIQREHARTDAGALRRKKLWLFVSIATNLSVLGFFKYFNFFIGSFSDLLSGLNVNVSNLYLDIILPVGISFYTFQTMSYTIDIYRGKMKPTRRLPEFALYVAFFPQLVAGPIERARALLPRILNKRRFEYSMFMEGVHLIFWGLFKKIYVADNLAPVVDRIFAMSDPSGWEVVAGAYTFAFQIYCDFSGYSDIARGCAKCLGIELMVNFNHPYVATNPSDFWRRWHISLSSWLRDYLYIPLGGNRHGTARTYTNLSLTMLLGGLWHGASWTFIVWGAYQGALLIGHGLLDPVMRRVGLVGKWLPGRVVHLFKVIAMFQLVCIGWIIFRAGSMSQIWEMLVGLFRWSGPADFGPFVPLLHFAGPLMLIELLQVALSRDDLQCLKVVPLWGKTVVYAAFFYLVVFYGADAQSFIYFQF